MKRHERLLEVAKTKNKQLLIESFDYSIGTPDKFSEKVEFVSKALKESLHNEEGIECLAIIRNVPVSHYRRNRNDREYSRPVWQSVAQKGSFENGFCLADHAEEEGSVTRIAGVWKNFVVRDDAPYADLYVLDNEHGQRIVQILKVKGKVGFSTVGFGELDENNSVIPESFEISEESVCDHVLVPSAGVFATNENLSEPEEQPKASGFLESVETNKQASNNTNNIQEGENKGIIMEKELQESVIKNNARVTIKEALSNSSKAEAIRDLKEFQSTVPSHMKETLDKVEATITRIAEELDKEVKDKDSKLNEATVSSKSLNEKLKMTEKLYEDLRGKHQKALKVLEQMKNSNVKTGKALSEAKKDTVAMYEDIKKFRQERFVMLEDIAKWLIKEGKLKEAKALINELKSVKEKTLFAKRISAFLEKSKKKENFGQMPDEMEENEFVEPLEPDFFGDEAGDEFAIVEEEPGATDPLAMDKEVDPSYEFQGDSIDAFEGGFEEEGEEEEGDFEFEAGSEVEGEEIEEEEFAFEDEDEMAVVEEGEEMEFPVEDEMTEEDEYETEEDEFMESDEEMEDEEEMEEEYTSPDSFEDEISTSYAGKFDGDSKGGFSQGFSEKKKAEKLMADAMARHKASLKKESAPKKVEKPVAKKESVLKKGQMKVRKDVLSFFESAVKINPSLKDIRKHVLSCKSLEEAYRVSDAFTRKQGDSSVKSNKVKESFSFKLEEKKGWMNSNKLL